MFTAEEIKSIHTELARVYGRGKILFGGSYLYGEASEASDLDFYLIAGLRDLLYYKKRPELVAPLKLKYPKITLMFVPDIFFRWGLYYVHGQNLAGDLEISGVSKDVVLRNCLKLACFHYLASLLTDEPQRKKISQNKCALQYTVAKFISESRDLSWSSEPIFSKKFLLSKFGQLKTPDLNDLQKASVQLGFSVSNYLIYNIRFILRGKFAFLAKNPDKNILGRIISGISEEKDLKQLYDEMKEIIFPVYIL